MMKFLTKTVQKLQNVFIEKKIYTKIQKLVYAQKIQMYQIQINQRGIQLRNYGKYGERHLML